MAPAESFVATYRDPAFLASLAETQGERHLDPDFELVRDTFHRFADEQIRPRAEHIHRANTDIPEEIISGMAEMGGFGMSVPEEYGGFAAEGDADYLSMVVATEELTWGSLGAGGSLITRPEILTRAIVKGGTEEQKQHWLPKLATAEVLGAVAVTEPDFGSDVAGVMLPATKVDGGWILNGVKTWCTFAARANVLLLLARTDPDRVEGPQGPVDLPGGEASGRRSRLHLHPGARSGRPAGRLDREDGGAGHRHPGLPGHALLRGLPRELVRARRQPDRRRVRARAGLLPADAGLRERAAADGGPGRGPHAGRLRGGASSTPPTGWCSARRSSTTSSPR